MSNGSEDRERNSRGRYTSEITSSSIKDVFKHADAPVLTSKEVADALGKTRRGVHNRLTEMYDDGSIERKEVGPSVVWYLPDWRTAYANGDTGNEGG